MVSDNPYQPNTGTRRFLFFILLMGGFIAILMMLNSVPPPNDPPTDWYQELWKQQNPNVPRPIYDARWGKTRPISGKEWLTLDQALRDAQNEESGANDVYLIDTLAKLGVHVDNSKDAYDAANYLVDRGYDQKKEQKRIEKEQKDVPQP